MWKKISLLKHSIVRITDQEQKDFENLIKQDKRVSKSSLINFHDSIERVQEGYDWSDSPNELKYYMQNNLPDEFDRSYEDFSEGKFSVDLEPGWSTDDGLHDFYQETRTDLRADLDRVGPCFCHDCVAAHKTHQNCDSNCSVVNNAQKFHSDDQHDFCLPARCSVVKRSHETDHELCGPTCEKIIRDHEMPQPFLHLTCHPYWCGMAPLHTTETTPLVERAHKNNVHSIYCHHYNCERAANSNHRYCVDNGWCKMSPWYDLVPEEDK